MRFSADAPRNARHVAWESVQTTAKHRVMWKSGEPDLFKNAGNFSEYIHRDAIGFTQLDAESMYVKYRPLSEPAGPEGEDGFVRISDNRF